MGTDAAPAAPLDPRLLDPDDGEERALVENEALERTAQRIRSLGIAVEYRILVDARPAHAIVDFASQHQIDLIAMTTHGRGALKRLVAGRVAEAVLHGTAAQVLLYRPEHPASS
jgi:nucleotide-binding universal stress UspA family protein